MKSKIHENQKSNVNLLSKKSILIIATVALSIASINAANKKMTFNISTEVLTPTKNNIDDDGALQRLKFWCGKKPL